MSQTPSPASEGGSAGGAEPLDPRTAQGEGDAVSADAETPDRIWIAQRGELPLPAGRYYVWGGVYRNWTNGEELIGWQPLTEFEVYGPELDAAPLIEVVCVSIATAPRS